MSDPFIGEVRMFGGNFAPRSWAFCDGQILPISQYTALFSLLGTMYGGDGRTTFGLPNLMGRSPMHPGHGPGLTPRNEGEKVGTETVTLTEQQMPGHTHTFTGTTSRGGVNSPNNARFTNNANAYHASANLMNMQAGVVSTTGGGQAHNNMQPFLVVSFIICLEGIYPPRS